MKIGVLQHMDTPTKSRTPVTYFMVCVEVSWHQNYDNYYTAILEAAIYL